MPCQHLALAEGQLPDTLCLPLMAQNETLGLLYLEVRADQAGVVPTPENYIDMLAENISLSLANIKLRDALRSLALHDPLTGLPNRRNFERVMEGFRAGQADGSTQLSCLMLDVDHFKNLNDRFGHAAGDEVLRELAGVLQEATREPEFAFRYGGEEFGVLLPDLTCEQAAIRAEEIRSRISDLDVQHAGKMLGKVTVSVGVASVPQHCDLSRLVQTADAAMYRAKKSGRDCVEVARIREEGLQLRSQRG